MLRLLKAKETGPYFRALLWVAGFSLLHLTMVYLTISYLPSPALHDSNPVALNKYFVFSFIIYGFLFIGFLYLYPVYVMIFIRPTRLFKRIGHGYYKHLLSAERVVFSFTALLLIPVILSAYTWFKFQISEINYFSFDELLYNLDLSLFTNIEPWRLLHPFVGHPWMTIALDKLYHPVWFWVLTAMVLWHALGGHSLKTRVQFFVSYIVVWGLLGNLGALLMSSAGPCYFDRVTSVPNPYIPLFEYLQSVNLQSSLESLELQEKLWSLHINNVLEYGSGISAMPSLHVATATLFALSAWKVSPPIGGVLFLFTFIIFIGSIHLGWHYAVDGLFSIPATWLIWHYTGKVLARDKILAPLWFSETANSILSLERTSDKTLDAWDNQQIGHIVYVDGRWSSWAWRNRGLWSTRRRTARQRCSLKWLCSDSYIFTVTAKNGTDTVLPIKQPWTSSDWHNACVGLSAYI